MPRPKARSSDRRRLFRVLPWREGAAAREPGHALHIPRIQGAGRIDNPEHYAVLYLSDAAVGAVAEAFGNHAIWTDGLFEIPSVPGARRALVTFEAESLEVLDLDDARALVRRRLKPSDVVTRDRARTRAWALAAFRERAWDGARWWSYYDPDWGSFGLWTHSALTVHSIEPLALDHAAVVEAARKLHRVVA